MMLWVVSAAVLLIASAAAVIVGIDSHQYRQNQQLIEKSAPDKDKAPSKTLVVFFSRSGNTEIMARKIAELTQADILPLQSARNQIGGGWLQALQDARNTDADITPNKVDLSAYDTVYIGSTVWLYSPAPQIYQFAKTMIFQENK